MAIAHDASTSGSYVIGASSISWSHSCAGSDRALFVGVVWIVGATGASATYNGTAMTELWDFLESTYGIGGCAGYMLAAPSTGSNTVAVTFNGTVDQAAAGSVSWTGVDQTTPARTAYTADDYDSSSPYTMQVTVVDSASGDVVIDCAQQLQAPTITAAHTSRVEQDGYAGGNASLGIQSVSASGASTVMNWTASAEGAWQMGAVAMIPASGGGGASIPLQSGSPSIRNLLTR